LRVPFYFVPRPYNELEITAQTVITNPATDMATFEITTSGPITSSLWAYPLLVSDPAETHTAGDIKAVGIDYGWNHATYGPILTFAIDAWEPWHLPHYYFVEFDIWVDINEDGTPDYVIYNTPYSGTNYFIPTIVNLTTGTARTSNYLIYVDFNSGYMEMYVPASFLGMSATNPNFDFQVVGYDWDSTEDVSAPGRFDYARYPFDWGATTLEPGPADPTATLGVWIHDLSGYTYSQPEGAMIVDYTGNPHNGGEVYLYDITLPDINTFSILHTNDFHGNLELAGSNPGITRMAKVINNVRSTIGAENVLLVDAGDEMQGSLLSNLSHGAATIDLFNFLGYQAATFGNHEFDWGQTVLQERMDQAEYPFLATNLVMNDTGNCATAGWTHPDYVQPWTTITVGAPGNEVVVGLIGVTSQETPYITVAEATQGLCFKDATESISHYYNDVVAAGAEVLVVISHLGNLDGGYGYGIPVYGDQTLARNLINAGKPVDLIIGGHSHTNMSAPQIIEVTGKPGKTYVVQAYYAGRRVGRADITYNRTNDTVAISWQSLTVSTTGEQDAATLARLNTWAQDPGYLELINTVIGYTKISLIRRSTMDNTMGAFVNDAIYNELNNDAEPLNNVDMVFNNSGGLRADIGGPPPTTTYPLTLTYGMLFSVLPFGNQTVVGDMTGAQIMELLNQSATLFKGTLQVAGIRFKYYSYGAPDTFDAYHNTWWAWGAYDVEVKNGDVWEPLEMDRVYRVGTNEFLAPAGQDGFAPFKYMTNISYWGDMLNQVLSWTHANYGTPETAYNGPLGDGTLLDGRIIREGDNVSGPIIPVTILHHNDSHGRLLPTSSAPGYTNLVTVIRQEWRNNPSRTILLHGGDTIQGDAMAAFYKAAFTGKGADGTALPEDLWVNPILKAMNAITYTAMTLGNHEYNFGGHIFTGTLGQANFPLLQANVYDDGRYGLAEVNVRPDITVTVGPEHISVAILGIGNHRVPQYELPSNIPGLTFTNPITETQNRAPALKAANDAVVALTHIGFTEDPKSVEVDANVDTNLAAQTTGVDVIIGSHSHTDPSKGYGNYKFLPTIVGSPDNVPVLINQAYRYNTYLGEVVLGMREKAGGGYEVAARAGKYIAVTTATPEDPAVKAIVAPYDAFLTTYRTRVLGQTIVPLDALNAFTEETNAANLQADASVWKLEKELQVDIDFHLSGAMTNAKVAGSASPTTPYTLTVGDMFTLMPYENSLLVMEINGAQLKAILERGYRNYWYYKYSPNYGGYSHYTTCMLDVNAGTVIT
ncbi:MAG TPA: 5'-nucleotidase C-terminal domain-containing protein, partial [Anaerolineae bacterium]|nr:5'-nucleotidase C-terminal domain-containing protein [Anaerolineae bacterium]